MQDECKRQCKKETRTQNKIKEQPKEMDGQFCLGLFYIAYENKTHTQ